jgi:peptidoglycan hydrolase-like protein with peptidoglycan-binding domain
LKRGNHGVEVEVLQQKLQQLNYEISTIDGDFGNGTKRAVIAFQTDAGQSDDGVVGPDTAKAIDDAITASSNTPSTSSSGSGAVIE